MPRTDLDKEPVDRINNLRIEDETDDEIINELINIYQAEELTLSFAGDRLE